MRSLALVGAVACGGANRRVEPPSVRTVYVWDCGQQTEVDLRDNGSLYLKGTDIPFRYGESCS